MIRHALALLIATTTSACAGWCDPTRDECWPREVKPKPPQVRAWVKHAPPRVIVKRDVVSKPERFDDTAHCKPPLQAVGDQALSEDTARTAAEKHWMANVRWRDGEKYMDFKKVFTKEITDEQFYTMVTALTKGAICKCGDPEHKKDDMLLTLLIPWVMERLGIK